MHCTVQSNHVAVYCHTAYYVNVVLTMIESQVNLVATTGAGSAVLLGRRGAHSLQLGSDIVYFMSG